MNPEYNKDNCDKDNIQEPENTDHVITYDSNGNDDNFVASNDNDMNVVENWRGLAKKWKQII